MPMGSGGESLFFSPALPFTTPSHGHFVLSLVPLASRELNFRHPQHRGKIGDCEQSFYNPGLVLTGV